MVFVNTNVNALKGTNHLSNVTERMNRSFEQLSSGSRINSARDDAAGLQISNRLDTQLIGTRQANRNIQDGISALQIADGAMSEITDIAHRMRQLSVQMSSNTLSQDDRDGAQLEIEELINAANRVAEGANLGGETPLLDGPEGNFTANSDQDIFARVTGMMEQAEANIKAHYGLVGDGEDTFQMLISNYDGAGNVVAFVSSSPGNVSSMTLDRDDFNGSIPNIDRIIEHEMVHAVMRNQITSAMPLWFTEGTAELIHGADDRLSADLAAAGSSTALMAAWDGAADDSADYSRAYVAARMLHDDLKEAGHAGGMRSLMQEMAKDGTTLDSSLQKLLGMTQAQFETRVQNDGASYIDNMDLTNNDLGGIGAFDADNLGIRNAADAVGDAFSYAEQPLEGFKLDWSAAGFTPAEKKTFTFQTGSNSGERSNFTIRGGSAERIGLAGVNVSANARGSIAIVDKALKNIHEIRREIGGAMAEMESMLRNNSTMVVNVSDSKSRITDTDFASATAELTRNQIIQQAASSVLAQANQSPNIALSLLGR
ncbi:flagellinolysin [Oceanospirillum beijerinckii]|uniref:flagellinolysin n=1 Tax=Oceanospirillum beijerinckii TaxID=64976 RepID=UPI000411AA03|nr:flagellinolysin [Oceanospirillum beijerinckii]